MLKPSPNYAKFLFNLPQKISEELLLSELILYVLFSSDPKPHDALTPPAALD
jgi:hypothetical protein